MTDGSFGAPLPGWTPPQLPGPMTLEGRWARLEPLAPGHAPVLHAANAADDRIWDYLAYGPFDAAGYADWVANAAAGTDPRFFAISDRARPGPLGVASLMRIDPANGAIEVGHVCLAPALQRSRAASEAIFLLADWAFAGGYRRFEWKCDARNIPSRRAAQRFGFSYEGVFRNHMIVKGRNRDTAWFAMIDADWPKLRAGWTAWLDPANFDGRGRQLRPLGEFTAPGRAASDPAFG